MHRGTLLAAAAASAPALLLAQAAVKPLRAAVIGWTGRGEFGHGFDQVFRGVENVTVEAVSDPDPAGLKKAAERSGARRQYRDYRELLEREKPDLVAICMRHPDLHREVALAALQTARGLFLEKPFTETMEDADAVLAAAEKTGARIAVAHVRRYTPEFLKFKALLDEGFLGEIRHVIVHGKQDERSGGEDLIVLGTHDFDFLRFCLGDPLWCFAQVSVGGLDVTRQDIRQGREPIRVAGDTVRAQFAFPKNVQMFWTSQKTGDKWNTNFSKREKWGFEVVGTKRVVVYQSGFGFAFLDSPFLAHLDEASKWQPLPEPANYAADPVRHSIIGNLVQALAKGGQPACSGYDGRWAIEMVSAVYRSHFLGARVNFPLADRRHPLA